MDSKKDQNESKYPPVQNAFDLFGEVAKLAAIQELNMRLLANKTQDIEDSAYEYSVAETNKKIIEHFRGIGALTGDEAILLSKSQTIRNKILHCEFIEAIRRIEKLTGEQAPGPSLKVMKFDPNIKGHDLLELLFTGQKSLQEGIGSPSMTGAVRESVRMFLPQNVLTKGCPKCPQSDRSLSLDCQIIKSFPAKG